MPEIGRLAAVKRHVATQEAQVELRDAIAQWAGYWDKSISEIQRRFYFKFGIDVMSAQALKAKDAIELTGRINSKMGE